jgi:hypothetical protein
MTSWVPIRKFWWDKMAIDSIQLSSIWLEDWREGWSWMMIKEEKRKRGWTEQRNGMILEMHIWEKYFLFSRTELIFMSPLSFVFHWPKTFSEYGHFQRILNRMTWIHWILTSVHIGDWLCLAPIESENQTPRLFNEFFSLLCEGLNPNSQWFFNWLRIAFQPLWWFNSYTLTPLEC